MYDDGIMNTTLTNKHFFDANNRSKNITNATQNYFDSTLQHFCFTNDSHADDIVKRQQKRHFEY